MIYSWRCDRPKPAMSLRSTAASTSPTQKSFPDAQTRVSYQDYKFTGNPSDKVARRWFWPSNRSEGIQAANKQIFEGNETRFDPQTMRRTSSAPKSAQSQRSSADGNTTWSSTANSKDLSIPSFLTRDMEKTKIKVERDLKKAEELERVKVLERHRKYAEALDRKKLTREQLERRSGSPYQRYVDTSKDMSKDYSTDITRSDISFISRRSPILHNTSGRGAYKTNQTKQNEDVEMERVEDIVLETEYEIDKFMSTMKPAKFLYMGTDLWM